jgi:ABC-type glucose/galactose transport system permease subunit
MEVLNQFLKWSSIILFAPILIVRFVFSCLFKASSHVLLSASVSPCLLLVKASDLAGGTQVALVASVNKIEISSLSWDFFAQRFLAFYAYYQHIKDHHRLLPIRYLSYHNYHKSR